LTAFLEDNIFPIGNMNIKNPEDLGATIKATRKQLKVTQKELAMTCGTGLRFIIDLEKGKPTCHIGKTLQVIKVLGLHIHLCDMRGDIDLDDNL
jgi:y4mF family transcriptional regulator